MSSNFIYNVQRNNMNLDEDKFTISPNHISMDKATTNQYFHQNPRVNGFTSPSNYYKSSIYQKSSLNNSFHTTGRSAG